MGIIITPLSPPSWSVARDTAIPSWSIGDKQIVVTVSPLLSLLSPFSEKHYDRDIVSSCRKTLWDHWRQVLQTTVLQWIVCRGQRGWWRHRRVHLLRCLLLCLCSVVGRVGGGMIEEVDRTMGVGYRQIWDRCSPWSLMLEGVIGMNQRCNGLQGQNLPRWQ